MRKTLCVGMCVMLGALGLAACTPTDGGGGSGGPGRVTVSMNGSYSAGFFSLPWPNAIRKKGDGTIDLLGMPTNGNLAISLLLGSASNAVTDFGTDSAVYLQLTGDIDQSTLPTPSASVADNSPIMLVDLDDPSDRIPVVTRIEPNDGYRTSDLLSLLPYPGHPLRPATRYAAIVTDGLKDSLGQPLVQSPTVSALDSTFWLGNARSENDWTSLRNQRDAVRNLLTSSTSWAAGDLVGFTVFTTQDTHREMNAVTAAVNAFPLTQPTLTQTSPCPSGGGGRAYLSGMLSVPMFQQGGYPYRTEGGQISFASDGSANVQDTHSIHVSVSVPCVTTPAGGFPITSYIDGTGGSADGSGGYTTASSSLIGSIGPLYNPLDDGASFDETLFYNYLNPVAARTNPIQQAANNLMLLRMLEGLNLPGTLAASPTPITTNSGIEILTGHSQGAETIAMVRYEKPGVDAIVSSSASAGQYNSLSYRSDIRDQFAQIIGDSSGLDIRNPVVQVTETLLDIDEQASFPTTGNWLDFVGRDDGCLPFEASRHLEAAQHLAVVNSQWGTILGDPSLDPTTATMPVSGNAPGGTTRVAVESVGGHFLAFHNTAMATSFVNQVIAGQTPVVSGPITPGTSDSCPPRFGTIGNNN